MVKNVARCSLPTFYELQQKFSFVFYQVGIAHSSGDVTWMQLRAEFVQDRSGTKIVEIGLNQPKLWSYVEGHVCW